MPSLYCCECNRRCLAMCGVDFAWLELRQGWFWQKGLKAVKVSLAMHERYHIRQQTTPSSKGITFIDI